MKARRFLVCVEADLKRDIGQVYISRLEKPSSPGDMPAVSGTATPTGTPVRPSCTAPQGSAAILMWKRDVAERAEMMADGSRRAPRIPERRGMHLGRARDGL
jgi:hypothetical protein